MMADGRIPRPLCAAPRLVALAVLAGVLLGCGGATEAPPAATPSADPGAPVASPTAEPAEAPVFGATDPAGNVSVAHIDLVAGEAYVDDDRLLVVFHLAALPEELEAEAQSRLDRFDWAVHVFPHGSPMGPPPYVIVIDPQLPGAGTFSAAGPSISYRAQAFEVRHDGPPVHVWPAAMDLDLEARTVSLAARIPGLGEATHVQIVTNRFEALDQPPAERDELRTFRVTPRRFALGATLPPAPQVDGPPPPPPALDGEPRPDGSSGYTLEVPGMTLRVVAPPGWSLMQFPFGPHLYALLPPGAEPIGAELDMGVKVVDLSAMPDLDSAATVLERIVSETGGAYEVIADAPPFDLPAGFGATALIRTVRPFQAGAEPGRVLTNWMGVEGGVIRLVVGVVGRQAVIGHLEALEDWAAAEPYLPYLAQMEIVAR